MTACPGCGRTTSTTFQELAERIQDYIRDSMPQWKQQYEGVEDMTLAVMGCIVNGPGESKAANIGISLPGTGEEPSCPVYIDGKKSVTLHGNYDELSAAFRKLVDDYIQTKYAPRSATPASASAGRLLSFISQRIHIGCTLKLSPPRRNHAELPISARGGSGFADCVFFASGRETSPRARQSKSAEESLDE